MLSPCERATMIRCCYDHDVAFCPSCARSYRVHRLGADWFQGKTELCPQCRADLSDSIREHLRSCEPVAALRARHLAADSQALSDESGARRAEAQQTQDEAGVRLAETEAELQKRRKPPPVQHAALIAAIMVAEHVARAALKVTRPAELPVEQPTKFEPVINLKTTRAFGPDQEIR